MQHHRDILAGLDDLVEVADAALAHGPGQGTVDPDGVASFEEIAAGQVRGGEIVMARHGRKRQAELRRHVGYEACLSAAGRALKQKRKLARPGAFEELAFPA